MVKSLLDRSQNGQYCTKMVIIYQKYFKILLLSLSRPNFRIIVKPNYGRHGLLLTRIPILRPLAQT